MAKKENTVPVTGGLEFGKYQQEVRPEVRPTPAQQQEPVPTEQTQETAPENNEEVSAWTDNLVDLYRHEFGFSGRDERVNIRKQFTITPTLNKQINQAIRNREIKSANSLVNFLLEKWFAGEIMLKK